MNGIEQALIGGVGGGTALLLPALGELIGQRAGIVNLGAEGCMLAGALSAFAVAVETGSAWTGVAAGLLAGAICGLMHAWLTIWCRADQLASGLVVWFLALGVTSVYGTGYISATITPLPAIAVPGLAGIPWVGPILFNHDGLVYLGYVLVVVIAFVLYRTRLGLLIRATGERPEVVAATGGRLRLVQLGAVVTGAGLAGVGGGAAVGRLCGELVLRHDQWLRICGRGSGALRRVATGPRLAGAYLFGIALAAASVLQAHGVAVNQYLLDALPYLVTLVALVMLTGRGSAEAPEALRRALTRSG
jgi:simple sugar transport system permease protein